jgi:hypothetical protein
MANFLFHGYTDKKLIVTLRPHGYLGPWISDLEYGAKIFVKDKDMIVCVLLLNLMLVASRLSISYSFIFVGTILLKGSSSLTKVRAESIWMHTYHMYYYEIHFLSRPKVIYICK